MLVLLSACLLIRDASIEYTSEDFSVSSPAADTGLSEPSSLPEANPETFQERWEQSQWLQLEERSSLWARLSSFRNWKIATAPMQWLYSNSQHCEAFEGDITTGDFLFDGSCTHNQVRLDGKITAISGIVEMSELSFSMPISEVSPYYNDCQGQLQTHYTGDIEARNHRMTLRLYWKRFVEDPSDHCPRYTWEIWTRSDVNTQNLYQTEMTGVFEGSGDVVVRVEIDDEVIEGRAVYQSSQTLEYAECPFEALNGATTVTSAGQALLVQYDGEAICTSDQGTPVEINGSIEELFGVGY